MQTNDLPPPYPARDHGVFLSGFLVLIAVGNLIGAVIHFSQTEEVSGLAPRMTTELVQLLGILCLANIGMAAGIWA